MSEDIVKPDDNYAVKIEGVGMPKRAIYLDASHSLTVPKLAVIFRILGIVIDNNIPGDLAEFGVFRGETSLCMVKFLESIDAAHRRVHMFDTYQGLPDPEPVDLGDISPDAWRHYEEYYGSIRAVEALMIGYEEAYTMYVGKFSRYLRFDIPLAFAHIDPDLYDGVKDALHICTNVMSTGGVIVIDDYDTSWTGVKAAVDEHLDPLQWHTLMVGNGQYVARRRMR